jgi:hypothetical protein
VLELLNTYDQLTGYISKGLNTPELMERKYTGNNTGSWSIKVNNYIREIKSK